MATIGVKVELEGGKAFQQGMKNLTTQTKLFDTQIKNVQNSVKKSAFAKSREQTELLKEKISALKDESALLSQRIKETSEAYGANDTRVLQLKQKYEALNGQIELSEKQLKDLGGTFGALGSQLDAIGSKVGAVGEKISSMGSELTTKVTLPIVAIGTKAALSFAEVDKVMALTNATMGNTEEQAKALNDAMEKAASNSTFGMTDAANATLNFARAGLDATQAANALAPAMNLAAGEGGDLNTVSAGLVATINGFQDSFEKTSYYADIFAAACNNSALDVNSLASSMSVAAPIFNTAGYSIQDASLYMGIMANNGIEASVAANSLKSGIARLAKPTDEAFAAMEKLGLEIFNADGSMKSSIEVQRQLHDSFAKLSEQEQISAAAAIFGKNQMASWLALINSAPSDVEKLNKSLSDCAGTTDEMSGAMMSGFGGSIEKLKSSVDVLVTSLGGMLADYIQPIIDKIQEWVDAFQSLDEEQKQQIVNVALAIAAIGPALLIVGKIITGIASLISAFGTISTFIGTVLVPAITAIGGALATFGTFITATVIPAIAGLIAALLPVLPIILGVAAAIAAIILVVTHWGEITDWITEKWTMFKEWLWQTFVDINMWIIQKIIEVTQKVGEAVGQIGTSVRESITNLKQNIVDGLTHIVSTVKEKLGNMKQAFLDIKDQALTWGADMIQNFINGILQKWEDLKTTVSNVAQTVADYLHFSQPKKGPLSDFNESGGDMMQNFAEGIKNAKYLVEQAVSDVAMDVNTMLTDPLDYEKMYDAVRRGASDSTTRVILNRRELTRGLKGMGVAFNG